MGAAVYALCLEITHREDLHRPALALYRRILEITDAIQILIENGCVDPVIPLSRSALEAVWSLEYLFQKDEDYEHRSLIYRYHNLRQNLQEYDPRERSEDVNKFLEQYSDEMGPEEEAELTGMRQRLECAEYRDLHSKFKNKKIPNNWYDWVPDAENPGTQGIKGLMTKLKRSNWYPTIYKAYSRVAHGGGHSHAECLRYPENMRDYTIRAAVLMKYAIGLMTIKFVPNKIDAYKAWDRRMQYRIDQLEESQG